MKIFLTLCWLFLCFFTNAQTKIQWISTDSLYAWETQKPIEWTASDQNQQPDILVNIHDNQQIIKGWGGCFNELGWDAIHKLDKADQITVMKALFDANDGLNFNICRMPVGANDYARNWYSLDETPGDFELKNFSIERDKGILIPYIREAMKYQPGLKLWASPWSPPTWMKTNKHYANKPGNYNALTWDKAVKNGDQFIQEPRYLMSYAHYLNKFIDAYHNEGINVYALAFQNEPYTFNQWPNCTWSPHAMGDFMSKYLGPQFQKNAEKTQLWLGTWNTDKIANFDTVLNNPAARKYIAGLGLQWESKNIIGALHQKYPQVELMQTESECGNGNFSWKDAEHTFHLIKTYLDGGVTSYTYWNMVLTDKGTSTWGWNQNALIRIDSQTKKVTYTPEYYLFKHFCHCVKPGTIKLTTTGNETNVVAFKDPQGQIIIVTENPDRIAKKVSVKVGDQRFIALLPAKSFNTFTVKL